MMDIRRIYAIVNKMVEEGIFSTDPGKINKEYIDNLNVLNCGNLMFHHFSSNFLEQFLFHIVHTFVQNHLMHDLSF